jgi:hypothetical protein
MKALKIILVLLLSLAALFVLVSFFLPSTSKIERSITIKAKPDVIYPYINSLKTWGDWTVWNKKTDSTLQVIYDGPDQGVGSKQTWKSKNMGDGATIITETREPSNVKYDLLLQDGDFKTIGNIDLLPAGDSTKVIWSSLSYLGSNVFIKYFGLFMEPIMGPDYEKGLSNLKKLIQDKVEAENKKNLLPADSLGNNNP